MAVLRWCKMSIYQKLLVTRLKRSRFSTTHFRCQRSDALCNQTAKIFFLPERLLGQENQRVMLS